jgi:hypothetical protein
VSAISYQPIRVVATFEDRVLVLRPVGLDGVEVTRERDGDLVLWHNGPPSSSGCRASAVRPGEGRPSASLASPGQFAQLTYSSSARSATPERMVDGESPSMSDGHVGATICASGRGEDRREHRVPSRAGLGEVVRLGRVGLHVEEPGLRRALGDLKLPVVGQDRPVMTRSPEDRAVGVARAFAPGELRQVDAVHDAVGR